MLPKREQTYLSNFEVKGQGFQHAQLCNSIPACASLKRKNNVKNYRYPVTQPSDQMPRSTSSVQHHGLKSDWDTEKVNCSLGLHCCLLGQLPYPLFTSVVTLRLILLLKPDNGISWVISQNMLLQVQKFPSCLLERSPINYCAVSLGNSEEGVLWSPALKGRLYSLVPMCFAKAVMTPARLFSAAGLES